MYYRGPLQTKKIGKYYIILYVGNLYNPYFEYINFIYICQYKIFVIF